MRPALIPMALMAVLLIALLTLPRIDIDTDVFNLLPAESREVQALQLYQRHFASAQDLLISLRAGNADQARVLAEQLAGDLVMHDLATRVLWQAPSLDPAERARMAAFLWINQDPQALLGLAQRLAPDQLDATLDESLQNLATSIDAIELARISQDPYGLSRSIDQAFGSEDNTAGQFRSDSGEFRLLVAQPPAFVIADPDQARVWASHLGDYLGAWKDEQAERRSSEIKLTGHLAFVAESGEGLLREIQSAGLATLLFIGALFWIMHRSWIPMFRLLGLLLLVLAVSVTIGHWILGQLNVVSLGFAAILLGIAADYGMIVHQEVSSHPQRGARDHWQNLTGAIVWAALTTAAAFLLISRSSLPGLAQLGALVAVGVITAAIIMLVGFLIGVKPKDTGNAPAIAQPPLAMGSRSIFVFSILLGILSISILTSHGLPLVDRGVNSLIGDDGNAHANLAEIERELGTWEADHWLIIEGTDEQTVADRLSGIEKLLDKAIADELIESYQLPATLWPAPDHQQANRSLAADLAEDANRLIGHARAFGFTDAALVFTEQVLQAWQEMTSVSTTIWPHGPTTDLILRQFLARDQDQGYLVLGRIKADPELPGHILSDLATAANDRAGAWLAAWPLLSQTLIDSMQNDLRRVLLPLILALVVLLWLAFRNLAEVALSLATIGLGLLTLMAVMSLVGWSWNLMNLVGIGLLLGLGVDYNIHMQFSLKRHGGRLDLVHATTGKALLLCGFSTAAGFASLSFVSNEGLASLGRVCAIGILFMCLAAIVLLPGWWRMWHGSHSPPETV